MDPIYRPAMKTFIALLTLVLFPGLALAQSDAQKPKPKPEAKPAAEAKPKPAAEAKTDKPKSDQPVLEITREGRPGCEIKPVMTDEEIEACRRAAYERR